MTEEPKQYIDKLALIEIRDKKLLMVRSKGKDVYYAVGGKREKGESDEQALIREVQEEIRVVLEPASIKYLATYEGPAHGQPEGTVLRLTCYTGSYSGEPAASSEIEELKWLSYKDRHFTDESGRIVLEDLKQKDLIE